MSFFAIITLCFNFVLCFAQLFFGSIPVLWILSAFDSLETISWWFPYFIFVGKSIQSSFSLFVLVICLWLCFWNSISFGINILDNFSLHSTVSLYNLDLSFVCQHFSMPFHVPQSLLCVGYCDCWFYSKIFIIPSVISIGLCWCLPHAYKLHFDNYFIVDFELSPDQAFSLDSINVCYHLYWLSDGCVVLILISISFWIRGFVFSDFCSSTTISDCEFVMLDNFLFCFVSLKLDWIFPSILMMFLKIPDIFKVILDWICTFWIWMYSVVNLFGFFALLSQIPWLWIWTLISDWIHPCVDFIEEIIDSISLFFLWQCHSEFVILGLIPWDNFSCFFGWWWKFSWFPSLLWNCQIYTFLLPFVISILDFIFTWISPSDILIWILKPILVLEGCSIKKLCLCNFRCTTPEAVLILVTALSLKLWPF